jgi:hypothetical protein
MVLEVDVSSNIYYDLPPSTRLNDFGFSSMALTHVTRQLFETGDKHLKLLNVINMM